MMAQATADSTSTFTTCNIDTSHVHMSRCYFRCVGGLGSGSSATSSAKTRLRTSMRLRLGGHGRRTLKSDRPHQFNFLFATYDQHHRRLPFSSHISQSWPSSWFSVAPLRATLAGLPPSLPPSRSAFRILDSAKHRHSARLHATGLVLTTASPNMLLSGSRDKTLIIWNLTRDETSYGYPKRSLKGHSHIVSDCVRTPRGRAWHGSNWRQHLQPWQQRDRAGSIGN
jgi:hypothetical protein